MNHKINSYSRLRSSNNTAANAGMVARNAAGVAMNNTNAMMNEKAARDVERDCEAPVLNDLALDYWHYGARCEHGQE